ncbi:MAG: bifunctional 2-polyprenyl-6-hydroxyphenol methylase/3-demethylubiquinol 3-O-methyltransferase UbiG [Pseudomonadota bacterium]
MAADNGGAFSAYSLADWWDERGPFRALHALNPVRLAYLRGQLGDIKGCRLADVGCGGGLLSEALAVQGARVDGFDEDSAVIEIARAHAKARGIDQKRLIYHARAPSGRQRYDAVIALEVIEHVDDARGFVMQMAQLVKPGGRLVISTLNRSLASRIGAIFIAERVLGWLPPGIHEFKRFIKPHELVGLMESSGLQVMDTCGFVYRPLTRRWVLDPHDLRINYVVSAKRSGGM